LGPTAAAAADDDDDDGKIADAEEPAEN